MQAWPHVDGVRHFADDLAPEDVVDPVGGIELESADGPVREESLLADVRDGMAHGDFYAVEMTAHLAKVAARNVAAKRAYESALQLESVAREGDLPGAQRASVNLEREVELLRVCLATLEGIECPA